MKKTIAIILLMLLLLTGCADIAQPVIPDPTYPTFNDVVDDYSTIYAIEEIEHTVNNDDAAVQKASDGYTCKLQQGYNRWYYQVKQSNGSYADMRLQDNFWCKNGAYMYKGRLRSTIDSFATRTFIIASGGEVYLNGNIKLTSLSEPSVEASIYLNDDLIYKKNIEDGDTIGYYYEVSVNVSKGDKLHFVIDGSGETYWNPIVNYTSIKEASLFYDTEEHLGDVHPFYDNGKMYMYYLSTDGSYTSKLLISDDMINYNSAALNFVNPKPIGEYFALGVIKEGDKYRSYYGYSQSVINSSVSNDLINWSNGAVFNTNNFKTEHLPNIIYKKGTKYVEVRDPYIFYDPDIAKYRIVYMAYYAKNSNYYDVELALTTSKSNSTKYWQEVNNVDLLRFKGAGNGIEEPEVPQMMKIGDRWYTFAYMHNRQGVNNRGMSYWFGGSNQTIEQVNWNGAQEYNLNGSDFVASQVAQVNGKYYLFGWISAGRWGGALSIAQEVYQNADGTLGVRLDRQLSSMLNCGKLYKVDANTSLTNGWTYSNNKLDTNGGEIQLEGLYNRTMLTGKITSVGQCGIVLKNKNSSSKVKICLDKQEKLIKVFAGDSLIATTPAYNLSDTSTIKVLIDGNYLDVYVDDCYSLTVNLASKSNALTNYSVSLYSQQFGSFDNFSINKLNSPSSIHN